MSRTNTARRLSVPSSPQITGLSARPSSEPVESNPNPVAAHFGRNHRARGGVGRGARGADAEAEDRRAEHQQCRCHRQRRSSGSRSRPRSRRAGDHRAAPMRARAARGTDGCRSRPRRPRARTGSPRRSAPGRGSCPARRCRAAAPGPRLRSTNVKLKTTPMRSMKFSNASTFLNVTRPVGVGGGSVVRAREPALVVHEEHEHERDEVEGGGDEERLAQADELRDDAADHRAERRDRCAAPSARCRSRTPSDRAAPTRRPSSAPARRSRRTAPGSRAARRCATRA